MARETRDTASWRRRSPGDDAEALATPASSGASSLATVASSLVGVADGMLRASECELKLQDTKHIFTCCYTDGVKA